MISHPKDGQMQYAGECPYCPAATRKAWSDEILPEGHDQVCLNCGRSSVRPVPEPCPRCGANLNDGHCIMCNGTGHFEDS